MIGCFHGMHLHSLHTPLTIKKSFILACKLTKEKSDIDILLRSIHSKSAREN